MSRMLASVENLTEARGVLEAGADIIDLKAPAAGALGALPLAAVREIVAAIGGQKPISATIGDRPMQPESVATAVAAMAATGVDFVKIGFFAGDWAATLAALQPLTQRGVRLVAVLFADQPPDLACVTQIAAAGFAGVMLDTQHKGAGALPQICRVDYLREFIALARASGLMSGLAGSLRLADIAPLLMLNPDYLGFRGALCLQNQRTAQLDADALRAVRARISGESNVCSSAFGRKTAA